MNEKNKLFMKCSHCQRSTAYVDSYTELEWLGWQNRNGEWWCPHCVSEKK